MVDFFVKLVYNCRLGLLKINSKPTKWIETESPL